MGILSEKWKYDWDLIRETKIFSDGSTIKELRPLVGGVELTIESNSQFPINFTIPSLCKLKKLLNYDRIILNTKAHHFQITGKLGRKRSDFFDNFLFKGTSGTLDMKEMFLDDGLNGLNINCDCFNIKTPVYYKHERNDSSIDNYDISKTLPIRQSNLHIKYLQIEGGTRPVFRGLGSHSIECITYNMMFTDKTYEINGDDLQFDICKQMDIQWNPNLKYIVVWNNYIKYKDEPNFLFFKKKNVLSPLDFDEQKYDRYRREMTDVYNLAKELPRDEIGMLNDYSMHILHQYTGQTYEEVLENMGYTKWYKTKGFDFCLIRDDHDLDIKRWMNIII